MGQHDVEGGAAARAAGLQQRRLEPAAVLVGAFQVHDAVAAAVALAADAGELREGLRVLQGEGVGGAGIEPHVENVGHLLPVGRIVDEPSEEALLRAGLEPGVGALLGDGLADARHQLVRLGEAGRWGDLPRLLVHEHGDGHAPGALARDHPVGPGFDHAAQPVLARGRHELGFLDGLQGGLAQRLVASGAMGRPCRLRDQSPSPLWGGVRGGGSPNGQRSAIPPSPVPPPRGGRGRQPPGRRPTAPCPWR